MIKTFLCTGDIHGSLERFYPSNFTVANPKTTGIIILGDSGFNYDLGARDAKMKHEASLMSFTFYCVRGNHEARPQDIADMRLTYDPDVQGNVYYEPNYPNIRYFLDGGFYTIGSKKTLVLGGAYSIDKEFRLMRHWPWFANEQLNEDERAHIMDCITDYYADGNRIDLVLSHTAPVENEPVEMFLDFIDQSKVDKSMEVWLQDVKSKLVDYPYFWLFGHYHADLIMADNVAMLYEKIIDIEAIDDFSNPYVEMPEGFRLSHHYTYWREQRGLPLFLFL